MAIETHARPLGVRPAVTLSDAQLHTLQVLADYDLGRVRSRLLREGTMPASWLDDAMLEFRRSRPARARWAAAAHVQQADRRRVAHRPAVLAAIRGSVPAGVRAVRPPRARGRARAGPRGALAGVRGGVSTRVRRTAPSLAHGPRGRAHRRRRVVVE